MNSHRENAPLVELVAELRWEPTTGTPLQPLAQTGSFPNLDFNLTGMDQFYLRFGVAVQKEGYTELVRLVPPGIPFLIKHQIAFRFNKLEPEGKPKSLYQLGPGVFTANAVPPYESWSQFAPVVKQGVEALLQSRPETERDLPFTLLTLRYIDAFNDSHTSGMDDMSFLKTLGVDITIPESLAKHLRPEAKVKPAVQLQIPMGDGLLMTFNYGFGNANGKDAILMDTTINTTLGVRADLDAVMDAFGVAHEAISTTFKEMVKPIDHLIPIQKGGAR